MKNLLVLTFWQIVIKSQVESKHHYEKKQIKIPTKKRASTHSWPEASPSENEFQFSYPHTGRYSEGSKGEYSL